MTVFEFWRLLSLTFKYCQHRTNYIKKHYNRRFFKANANNNKFSILRAAVYKKDRNIKYLKKDWISAENDNEHNNMLCINKGHNDTIIKSYPEDIFQRIFLMVNVMIAQAKSSNGFHWNPENLPQNFFSLWTFKENENGIYLHIVLKVTEVRNKTLQALSLDMPHSIGVGKGGWGAKDSPTLKLEGLRLWAPPPNFMLDGCSIIYHRY